MSQEALGRRVGRSTPIISSYENNLKFPPLDVLIDMSNVFNVSLDYLVGKKKTKSLNTNGLNQNQIDLLHLIVEEFREQNRAINGLTPRQMQVLNSLLQFFFK